MKIKTIIQTVALLFASLFTWAEQGGEQKLWYDKPATVWKLQGG